MIEIRWRETSLDGTEADILIRAKGCTEDIELLRKAFGSHAGWESYVGIDGRIILVPNNGRVPNELRRMPVADGREVVAVVLPRDGPAPIRGAVPSRRSRRFEGFENGEAVSMSMDEKVRPAVAALEGNHIISILVFLRTHGPAMKSEIYEAVAYGTRMSRKLEELEGIGLLTISVSNNGRMSSIALTDAGIEVADHLIEISRILEKN